MAEHYAKLALDTLIAFVCTKNQRKEKEKDAHSSKDHTIYGTGSRVWALNDYSLYGIVVTTIFFYLMQAIICTKSLVF